MRTVAELFARLERGSLHYAVLRNYEHFPDLRGGDRTRNTDLDLVVRSEELAQFREVLTSLAADFGWDILTECTHYARSQVGSHRIEVFQFYRTAPLEYLQVDVFHAFLVWGLPFMDEADLLAGRRFDGARGLTHLAPLKEHVFRLVQIHGLGRAQRTAAKRERYRRKIEAFREVHEREYMAAVRSYFGRAGEAACAALRAGDSDAFAVSVNQGKRHFWLRYLLRHPVTALRTVAERRRETRLRWNTDPCGCVLRVHASSPGARSRFDAAMDLLIGLNVIDEWAQKSWSRAFNAREQEILEQGGVLVEWTDRASAVLVVAPHDDPGEIAGGVVRACAGRHRLLHQTAADVEAAASLARP